LIHRTTVARLGVVAGFWMLFGLQLVWAWWREVGFSWEPLAWSFTYAAVAFGASIPGFAAIVWTQRRTAASAVRLRWLSLACAVLASSLVFAAIVAVWFARDRGGVFSWLQVAGFMPWFVIVAIPLLLVLVHTERAGDFARQLAHEHRAQLERERQAAEARLQRLQSQIEPHFLFNTLASIKELARRDPGCAASLLTDLAEYLRQSVPAANGSLESTVAAEVARTEAYLRLFAIRMAGRLKTDVRVPGDIRDAALPPLMLGTLVENAIKHGIAPRADGGTVGIEFRRDGDDLVMTVSDDGLGFRGQAGGGIGLANTQARLAMLYGDNARLDVSPNPGGGVLAAIRLPFRLAA